MASRTDSSETMEEATESAVRVLVRVRPFHDRELSTGFSVPVIRMPKTSSTNVIVLDPNYEFRPREMFTFDSCLWSIPNVPQTDFISQETMYRIAGEPARDNVLAGYNACILAYGQTGSGKTYTMMGDPENSEEQGIIPRVFTDLQHACSKTPGMHLQCTYLEIYNERVMDLLEKSDRELRVRNDPLTGPFVEGLSIHGIKTKHDILHLLRVGNAERHTASTKINERSSRSHAILTIFLCRGKDGTRCASKLHLVDLAGSERTYVSGAEGIQFKEATKINLSLTTLGRVIDALADHSSGRSALIPPYRESLLTWILSDSFGGNSKTCMIAAISPASISVEETTNTLRYASRAREIINMCVINEDPYERRIKELLAIIERLRRQLSVVQAQSKGISTPWRRNRADELSRGSPALSLSARSEKASYIESPNSSLEPGARRLRFETPEEDSVSARHGSDKKLNIELEDLRKRYQNLVQLCNEAKRKADDERKAREAITRKLRNEMNEIISDTSSTVSGATINLKSSRRMQKHTNISSHGVVQSENIENAKEKYYAQDVALSKENEELKKKQGSLTEKIEEQEAQIARLRRQVNDLEDYKKSHSTIGFERAAEMEASLRAVALEYGTSTRSAIANMTSAFTTSLAQHSKAVIQRHVADATKDLRRKWIEESAKLKGNTRNRGESVEYDSQTGNGLSGSSNPIIMMNEEHDTQIRRIREENEAALTELRVELTRECTMLEDKVSSLEEKTGTMEKNEDNSHLQRLSACVSEEHQNRERVFREFADERYAISTGMLCEYSAHFIKLQGLSNGYQEEMNRANEQMKTMGHKINAEKSSLQVESKNMRDATSAILNEQAVAMSKKYQLFEQTIFPSFGVVREHDFLLIDNLKQREIMSTETEKRLREKLADNHIKNANLEAALNRNLNDFISFDQRCVKPFLNDLESENEAELAAMQIKFDGIIDQNSLFLQRKVDMFNQRYKLQYAAYEGLHQSLCNSYRTLFSQYQERTEKMFKDSVIQDISNLRALESDSRKDLHSFEEYCRQIIETSTSMASKIVVSTVDRYNERLHGIRDDYETRLKEAEISMHELDRDKESQLEGMLKRLGKVSEEKRQCEVLYSFLVDEAKERRRLEALYLDEYFRIVHHELEQHEVVSLYDSNMLNRHDCQEFLSGQKLILYNSSAEICLQRGELENAFKQASEATRNENLFKLEEQRTNLNDHFEADKKRSLDDFSASEKKWQSLLMGAEGRAQSSEEYSKKLVVYIEESQVLNEEHTFEIQRMQGQEQDERLVAHYQYALERGSIVQECDRILLKLKAQEYETRITQMTRGYAAEMDALGSQHARQKQKIQNIAERRSETLASLQETTPRYLELFSATFLAWNSAVENTWIQSFNISTQTWNMRMSSTHSEKVDYLRKLHSKKLEEIEAQSSKNLQDVRKIDKSHFLNRFALETEEHQERYKSVDEFSNKLMGIYITFHNVVFNEFKQQVGMSRMIEFALNSEMDKRSKLEVENQKLQGAVEMYKLLRLESELETA